MTLQLASDIALTAAIIDAATGLVPYGADVMIGSDIIDAEYTVVSEGAPIVAEPIMLAGPMSIGSDTVTAKKVYATPYIPRGQFMKALREQGKLAPRAPAKRKAAQPAEEKIAAKPARQRSAKELAAIRRHYGAARSAA
ncbi:MAG: hypothetical protein DI537_10415 [Stutzerimonas stutzeri]|nr:MAG: hypothetical protein DI537_10415 [Stutzerimonas stutzeri]